MIGVDPLGGPIFTDSRDLWWGKRMNTKNTINTMNMTHKSKGKLTDMGTKEEVKPNFRTPPR
jgi:hypothetical protein